MADPGEARTPTAPLRVVFAGTPSFAVPSLRALAAAPGVEIVAVCTQPDRPAGRGRRPRPSAVKEAAAELGLPVRQPESLRAPEAVGALAALAPDLMVVVAYGLILPPAVLALPRLGCVNVHASLLPRWRGAAPVQWAILAGDRETGVCLMRMDEGLDTGPVLACTRTAIGPRETAGELEARLADLGAGLLARSLPRLAAGALEAVPQDGAAATYAPKIAKADAELDWRLPAAELDRRVRAFHPRPVAWTRLDGEPLRVWRAEPLAAPAGAEPGVVVAASGHPEVACGEGRLRLLEVQPAGGRRMDAAAFARGRALAGRRLG